MRCYLYLFFVLLLFKPGAGIAANPVDTTKADTAKSLVAKTDSSAIQVRNFDKSVLNKYHKQPEFDYTIGTPEGPSLWTRFKRWLNHLLEFLFRHHPTGSFMSFVLKGLEYLAILAALCAIVFFILKMAGINLIGLFRKKSKIAGLSYSEGVENIHDINFDTEIENAINQRNYRLAVRLLYLKSLKQLNDASLIDWQPDKTNSAYINELNNPEQKGSFSLLTRQFEYVWYGEFPIDGNVFDRINYMFQKFKSDIA